MTNPAATAAATARGKEAFSESSAACRTGQQTSILGPRGLGKSNLMEEVSGDVRVGGGLGGMGDKDKDTPSSTPLPPPLGVPIVTHSMGKKQGTCTCTCLGCAVLLCLVACLTLLLSSFSSLIKTCIYMYSAFFC